MIIPFDQNVQQTNKMSKRGLDINVIIFFTYTLKIMKIAFVV